MRDEYIIARGVYTDQGVTRFWKCNSCSECIALKRLSFSNTTYGSWFPVKPHLCLQHGVETPK